MFFFPIRTDRRLKRTPWMNYALIAINIVIFILTAQQVAQAQQHFGVSITRFYLFPEQPQLWQFVTYQFLHADWQHLLGNMIFLYVFGNSVEDRLGKLGYLAFYLAGGIAAGIGHSLVEPNPVLGASGAVAAVTGAYLALFPLTDVTILYWFVFIIDTFIVSSLVLILFRVAVDTYFFLGNVGNTAYLAHLSGYGFGFVVGMGMLWCRLLPREPYDLLALIEQKRRRASFRRMTQKGYQPWESGSAGSKARGKAKPLSPEQEALMEERAAISEALQRESPSEAARLYRQLLQRDPTQVMSQQAQLDLANQLMADAMYDDAAAAYELFVQQYGKYNQLAHVQLILGLIYARYLDQPARAREVLDEARPFLVGEDATLAESVLSDLPPAQESL